jgi:hypothetical protein
MNKTQKLKEIAQKLDVIEYWKNNPTSRTFRRIIKYQREVLENEEEESVTKSAYKLKHQIWVAVNKTTYLSEETEKVKLINIFEELEKLVGKEVKN